MRRSFEQRRFFPNAHPQITRHGKEVWYWRVGHGDRIRLSGEPFSPEFLQSYNDAEAGLKPSRGKGAKSGAVRWLLDQYKASAEWGRKRAAFKRILEGWVEKTGAHGKVGDLLLTGMTRRLFVEGLNERAATPFAANEWFEAVRALFRYGVLIEAIKVNPTDGVRRLTTPRGGGDDDAGFKQWSEEELAQFENFYPLGTRERKAYAIMLKTGLRVSDAACAGEHNVNERGEHTIRMEKTGKAVTCWVRPDLREALDACPSDGFVWWVGARGKPLTASAASAWFNEAAVKAGLKDCTCHGLRKAAARRYAELGYNEAALNAIFGWDDPKMAAKYVGAARNKRLAVDAMKGAWETEQARAGNVVPLTQFKGEGKTSSAA